MKILLLTDILNPGLKEDMMIAKSFIKDGHNVIITRMDYDEKLDNYFDIIIKRNVWFNNDDISTYNSQVKSLTERLYKKNIKTINFNSIYCDYGKTYLLDLYRKNYQVIPTFSSIIDLKKQNINYQKYIIKPILGNNGNGIKIVDEDQLITEFNTQYLIQPYIEFESEIEFYFINNVFEYVLEFKPSKKPVYPIPTIYNYTKDELALAQSFANLNKNVNGIQRIDFLKTKTGLLLLEIGDSAPYLNLNSLPINIRKKFIKNYKNMVYNSLV